MSEVLIPCKLCHQNIKVGIKDKHVKILCKKCEENPKHWLR